MALKNRCKRFVRLIAERINADKKLSKKEQTSLFKKSVKNIKNSDMKSHLEDNFIFYKDMLLRYLEECDDPEKDGSTLVTSTSADIPATAEGQASSMTNVVIVDSTSTSQDVSIKNRDGENKETTSGVSLVSMTTNAPKFVYNLFTPNSKIDRQIFDHVQPEKQEILYTEFLRQKLRNSRKVKTSYFKQWEQIVLVNIPKEYKTCVSLYVSEQSHRLLAGKCDLFCLTNVMYHIYCLLQEFIDPLVASQKVKRCKSLCRPLRQNINFFHMKYISSKDIEALDYNTRYNYADLVASFICLYMDVTAISHRASPNQLSIGNDVVAYVSRILQDWPDRVFDVVRELRGITRQDHNIVLPLVRKHVEAFILGGKMAAPMYTKLVLCVKKVIDVFDSNAGDVQQLANNIRAPKGYVEWLRDLDSALVDEMPEDRKFKGRVVTRFMLAESSVGFRENLATHLVLGSSGQDIETDVVTDHPSQQPPDTSTATAAESLFFIDVSPPQSSQIQLPDLREEPKIYIDITESDDTQSSFNTKTDESLPLKHTQTVTAVTDYAVCSGFMDSTSSQMCMLESDDEDNPIVSTSHIPDSTIIYPGTVSPRKIVDSPKNRGVVRNKFDQEHPEMVTALTVELTATPVHNNGTPIIPLSQLSSLVNLGVRHRTGQSVESEEGDRVNGSNIDCGTERGQRVNDYTAINVDDVIEVIDTELSEDGESSSSSVIVVQNNYAASYTLDDNPGDSGDEVIGVTRSPVECDSDSMITRSQMARKLIALEASPDASCEAVTNDNPSIRDSGLGTLSNVSGSSFTDPRRNRTRSGDSDAANESVITPDTTVQELGDLLNQDDNLEVIIRSRRLNARDESPAKRCVLPSILASPRRAVPTPEAGDSDWTESSIKSGSLFTSPPLRKKLLTDYFIPEINLSTPQKDLNVVGSKFKRPLTTGAETVAQVCVTRHAAKTPASLSLSSPRKSRGAATTQATQQQSPVISLPHPTRSSHIKSPPKQTPIPFKEQSSSLKQHNTPNTTDVSNKQMKPQVVEKELINSKGQQSPTNKRTIPSELNVATTNVTPNKQQRRSICSSSIKQQTPTKWQGTPTKQKTSTMKPTTPTNQTSPTKLFKSTRSKQQSHQEQSPIRSSSPIAYTKSSPTSSTHSISTIDITDQKSRHESRSPRNPKQSEKLSRRLALHKTESLESPFKKPKCLEPDAHSDTTEIAIKAGTSPRISKRDRHVKTVKHSVLDDASSLQSEEDFDTKVKDPKMRRKSTAASTSSTSDVGSKKRRRSTGILSPRTSTAIKQPARANTVKKGRVHNTLLNNAPVFSDMSQMSPIKPPSAVKHILGDGGGIFNSSRTNAARMSKENVDKWMLVSPGTCGTSRCLFAESQ